MLYLIYFSIDRLETWYVELPLQDLVAAQVWEPDVQFWGFWFLGWRLKYNRKLERP